MSIFNSIPEKGAYCGNGIKIEELLATKRREWSLKYNEIYLESKLSEYRKDLKKLEQLYEDRLTYYIETLRSAINNGQQECIIEIYNFNSHNQDYIQIAKADRDFISLLVQKGYTHKITETSRTFYDILFCTNKIYGKFITVYLY